MYTKSYSNLVRWLLFVASLLASVHLDAAKSWLDDSSSEVTAEELYNAVKPFSIRSEFDSKRLLGISLGGKGNILKLEDPQNTTSQQWYLDNDGVTIRSKLNGFCLNPVDNYPAIVVGSGYSIGTHGCRRGESFVYNHVSHQIVNHKEDLCLDIGDGTDTLGGNAVAKKCYDIGSKRLNQKWSLDYITNNVEKANI